jgi:hypothetical protein
MRALEQSRKAQLKTLSGAGTGDVEKVGADHGMAEHRGNVNYVRWRYEKDVKPPGYGGLSIADTFEFAAISPGFATVKASEDLAGFGKNQYGDGHVVYKDDVKDRAVYQFTAKGALRRDPMLLLHDIAVGAPAAMAASQAAWQLAKDEYDAELPNTPARALKLVALQQADTVLQTAKSKDAQAGNVLKAIFAAIAAKKLGYIDQQQIEVRIFGRVNFATDVKELHIGNGNTQAVKDNAKAFARANGIKFSLVKPGSAEIRWDSAVEQTDLTAQQADKAKHLQTLYDQWNASMQPPRWQDNRWNGEEARAEKKDLWAL